MCIYIPQPLLQVHALLSNKYNPRALLNVVKYETRNNKKKFEFSSHNNKKKFQFKQSQQAFCFHWLLLEGR